MPTTSEKLENFLRAFGAARVLLQQSHEHGTLIEAVVLYAALVDGQCRICLVLDYQIKNKTPDIREEYIFQDENDRNFSERQIYALAFKSKVIDQEIFDELNYLYNIRNKIVHRFFISEVEYWHMEVICERYEKLFSKLNKVTYDLENEQIENKVGMTVRGKKLAKADDVALHIDIFKKIKTKSERNLAKTLDYTSVEEIVEFASEKGLLETCLCEHEKIHHINTDRPDRSLVSGIDDLLIRCSVKNCTCERYKLITE